MVLLKIQLFYSFIFTVFLSHSTSAENIEPVVKTKRGSVRGSVRYALGSSREVYSFFGIPYARTPDYTFRFRPPVNPWGWTEVKNVTDEKVPFCYQDRKYLKKVLADSVFQTFVDEDHPITEDCLTVNIFTPSLPSNKSRKEPLPVVVWFHGGSFQVTVSSNKMWALPAFEDVVLVTVQYRLGVFGFLSFDDNWAPPNSGLHDQVKALQWIKKNIVHFGGNPNSVTIFGLSAGGIAVSAHAVSPLSSGLFHRMIAGSGVLTVPIVWGKDQPAKASQIANNLGCGFKEICFTATCLRNKMTSSQIVEAARDANATFVLAMDEEFFPEQPDVLVEKNLNSSVTMMVGVVAGEMDYILLRKFLPSHYFGPELTRKVAEEVVEENLEKYHPEITVLPGSKKKLTNLYLKDNATWEQLLFGLAEFFADAFFNLKAVQFAAAAKENGARTYFYNFALKPSFYRNKMKPLKRPVVFDRADHGDDQAFYFGFPFLSDSAERGLIFTKEEKLLSRKMMKSLATFARTGYPMFDEALHWREYPSYIDINKEPAIEENFRHKYLNVWNKLLRESKVKNLSDRTL